MSAADAGTAAIVFARAPSPGAVKTRLIPLLGAEGAAALHAQLAKRTLETARAASFARIELHGTPDVDDPFFRSCAGRFAAALAAQVGADLGVRMHSAWTPRWPATRARSLWARIAPHSPRATCSRRIRLCVMEPMPCSFRARTAATR